MKPVKDKRRYDSSGRQEQARRNREAILAAAERQFFEAGYAATTVSAIAREAAVSVETVYKAFGGKAGLVKDIYERGLSGHGPVHAYQRSDEMREHETDPKELMRKWGLLTAEVASVLTPIRLLMRSAADSDPEMAAQLEDSDTDRLERMRHNAQFLKDHGHLREGTTLADATDILWTCSSAEL
ncbi:MAG TPA: helix-turn-helix domain-containing protein, partial [Kribbella sp.]